MKQPDLGLKVTELRQEKGITQEQLAEHCEISTRTIQRIESGEVDPRTYTLKMLSDVLDFDFCKENTQNENFWLAALHLSSIFSNIVIPLLIWSWKKNQSYKIDRQGRDALNFQITITLMLVVGVVFMLLVMMSTALIFTVDPGVQEDFTAALMLAPMSILPLIFIGIFAFYQGIANTIRALSDRPVKYMLAIPFVK